MQWLLTHYRWVGLASCNVPFLSFFALMLSFSAIVSVCVREWLSISYCRIFFIYEYLWISSHNGIHCLVIWEYCESQCDYPFTGNFVVACNRFHSVFRFSYSFLDFIFLTLSLDAVGCVCSQGKKVKPYLMNAFDNIFILGDIRNFNFHGFICYRYSVYLKKTDSERFGERQRIAAGG